MLDIVERLGFQAVILHEQANQGQTIIEKFESNSDVGFAIVLLSPDDEGRNIGSDHLKPRARQNVIFELGFFIGKLGRSRVVSLLNENVEIPTDFSGVTWEKFDSHGGWRANLARELLSAGYELDLKKVLEL